MMKAREDMDTKVRNKKTWEGENQKEKNHGRGMGIQGLTKSRRGETERAATGLERR